MALSLLSPRGAIITELMQHPSPVVADPLEVPSPGQYCGTTSMYCKQSYKLPVVSIGQPSTPVCRHSGRHECLDTVLPPGPLTHLKLFTMVAIFLLYFIIFLDLLFFLSLIRSFVHFFFRSFEPLYFYSLTFSLFRTFVPIFFKHCVCTIVLLFFCSFIPSYFRSFLPSYFCSFVLFALLFFCTFVLFSVSFFLPSL